MKTLRCLALAAALAAAGCSDDDDGPAVTTPDAAGSDAAGTPDGAPPPDAGGTDTAPATDGGAPDTLEPVGITLVDWVDDLTKNHTNATSLPDTVDDKKIIDTEDPAAFDPLLQ